MLKLFDSPVILFNKRFDDESLSNFMKEFSEVEVAGEERVTILINSPGGSVDVLKTILDTIYNTDVFVTTVASGLAASCGFALLMAGDQRLAFPDTMLMSHQYSWGSRGKHHELIAARKAQDITNKFMIEHYKLHTGLPEARIVKELLPAEDRWITVDEAVELGVIDDIIMPKSKPIGIVERRKAMERNKKEFTSQVKSFMSTLSEKEFKQLMKGIDKNGTSIQKAGRVEPREDNSIDSIPLEEPSADE